MQYKLKNTELQAKLDALTNGDFSKQLKAYSMDIQSRLMYQKVFDLWFGEEYLHALELTKDMLTEIKEYNPHSWNTFPDVTPPTSLEWCRCEMGINRQVAKYHHDIDKWINVYGEEIKVNRFRPWDDEE